MKLSFGAACDGLIGRTRDLQGPSLPDSPGPFSSIRDQPLRRGLPAGFMMVCQTSRAERRGCLTGICARATAPSYVRSVFDHVSWMQFEVFALCFVLFLIARPAVGLPQTSGEPVADVGRVKSRVTRTAFEAHSARNVKRERRAGSVCARIRSVSRLSEESRPVALFDSRSRPSHCSGSRAIGVPLQATVRTARVGIGLLARACVRNTDGWRTGVRPRRNRPSLRSDILRCTADDFRHSCPKQVLGV